jgi:hypothetical protein
MKRFLYFTFIDLFRFRPLMLRSTHERIMRDATNRTADIDNHYWKQFFLSCDWEKKYDDLLMKTQKKGARDEQQDVS